MCPNQMYYRLKTVASHYDSNQNILFYSQFHSKVGAMVRSFGIAACIFWVAVSKCDSTPMSTPLWLLMLLAVPNIFWSVTILLFLSCLYASWKLQLKLLALLFHEVKPGSVMGVHVVLLSAEESSLVVFIHLYFLIDVELPEELFE